MDHDAGCPPMSAQVQNKIDDLTVLDQLLYTAAQEEYAKVLRIDLGMRLSVPRDSTFE